VGGNDVGESNAAMNGTGLDPDQLVSQFPGPAALFDAAGRVMRANGAADALLAALGGGQLPALATLLDATLRDGQMRQDRADVPGPRGGTALQVTLIPHGDAPDRSLLLFGRDATLERNLIQALMQSRQLFKDLVTCSTDFAWETKADGKFSFVSPRGALGYTARELDGRSTRDFAAPESPATPLPSTWPFEAHDALDAAEVFLARKDGSVGCFEVACLPVRDAKGVWTGVRGVARDVTEARARVEELRRAHKQLDKLASTDGLTGMLNRRAFLAEIDKRLSRHLRNRRRGTLIYFDLDNFKKVNDLRGHQAGDDVLRGVAEITRRILRGVDLASRIGGDEFLLWLEEVDRPTAEPIAARLHEAVRDLDRQYGAEGFPLGFSIGAVFSRIDEPETAEALIARADEAMYTAKKGGKGRSFIAPLPDGQSGGENGVPT